LLTIGALLCIDAECASQLMMQRVIWEVLAKGRLLRERGTSWLA
jgi:hypothetical protein